MGVSLMSETYADAKWLRDEYVTGRRTLASIAQEAGVSLTTVHRWVHKYNIRMRSVGRPRLYDRELVHANMGLSPDMAKWLRRRARATRVSFGAVTRDVLEVGVAEIERHEARRS